MLKKVITIIISMLTGVAVGIGTTKKKMSDKVQKVQAMSDKHFELFKMMNQWVYVKQEGKNLADYLLEHGYKKIAIYGMSFAGETLLHELENSDVSVVYGIDRNAVAIFSSIDLYTPDEDIPEVDAVVVTTITFFEEVEKMLSGKLRCPIISLEDILYEV